MDVKERYKGSENEYSQSRISSNKGLKDEAPPGLIYHKKFLRNGGKLYIDMGLIEYATPEVLTVEELVAHEIAGEEIAWETYGIHHKNKYTITALHKRSLAPDREFTTGSHENYETSVNILDGPDRDYHTAVLATHFATRTCFIGAGVATEDGFLLGQKIQGIKAVRGYDSTNRKPLVHIRNEPHAGRTNPTTHRLHVIPGDANISPEAIRLKFLTTSLVLRLIEHNVDLRDLAITKPLEAAQLVAGDVHNMTLPIALIEGGEKSALEIQLELAQRAKILSREIALPKEEHDAIDKWIATIDALKAYLTTDEERLEMRQLDWYAKQTFIQRNVGKDVSEKRLDIYYSQLPTGMGLKLRKHPEWFLPKMPPPEKIALAKQLPSEGRSKARGAMIEQAVLYVSTNKRSNIIPDWDTFRLFKDDAPMYETRLPSDVEYTDEEIKNRLQHFPHRPPFRR